jgi:hypothetical protein
MPAFSLWFRVMAHGYRGLVTDVSSDAAWRFAT